MPRSREWGTGQGDADTGHGGSDAYAAARRKPGTSSANTVQAGRWITMLPGGVVSPAHLSPYAVWIEVGGTYSREATT